MKNNSKLDQQLEEEFAEDVLDLRSKLSVVTGLQGEKHAAPERRSKPRLRMIIPGLAIAASLILAVLFVPGLWNDGGNGDLYGKYYEPYEMALNQRGNGQDLLNSAIIAYQQHDYKEASELFKGSFDSSGDIVHLLYAASAEQALGNDKVAIELYDQVLLSKNEKVIEQAQWFKALALVKIKNFEEAKSELSKLPAGHYKNKEIQELLSKLE